MTICNVLGALNVTRIWLSPLTTVQHVAASVCMWLSKEEIVDVQRQQKIKNVFTWCICRSCICSRRRATGSTTGFLVLFPPAACFATIEPAGWGSLETGFILLIGGVRGSRGGFDVVGCAGGQKATRNLLKPCGANRAAHWGEEGDIPTRPCWWPRAAGCGILWWRKVLLRVLSGLRCGIGEALTEASRWVLLLVILIRFLGT